MSISPERLQRAYRTVQDALLAERNAEGFWVGELSTSALSTATAVAALSLVEAAEGRAKEEAGIDAAVAPVVRSRLRPWINGGLRWLAEHQNADGGWGDTTKSLSNISTTMLAHAAFHVAGRAAAYQQRVDRAASYIDRAGGIAAVRARYGKDRTFAVPILTTAALAGQADWRVVSPLPFELACLSHGTFHLLRLPVVSYALPALIAVGQVKFAHDPPRNPLVRLIRRAAVHKSLRVLESIQPTSGGFLEAIPLTSFVVLSLAGAGRADHPVARRGVEFLLTAVRPDGAWPIDSNLSVWLTTLSINALAAGRGQQQAAGGRQWAGNGEGMDRPALSGALWITPEEEDTEASREWLLERQFRKVHRYTNSPPSGWGWTHLPGSVPDADDTAGALLALHNLRITPESRRAAVAGIRWLLCLQNRDGGWPTFCRGWGHLPFDRSGADLTAHALRALHAWRAGGMTGYPSGIRQERFSTDHQSSPPNPRPSPPDPTAIDRAIARGLIYLQRHQRPDGSWVPLWFGNQYAPGEENPTYGTARVLAAYRDLELIDTDPAQRGIAWLVAAQNADGGWGGAPGTPSTLEETALAVEALASVPDNPLAAESLSRGVHWLVAQIETETYRDPSPIGFYFAKLWYFERLYPLIFTTAALGAVLRRASTLPALSQQSPPRNQEKNEPEGPCSFPRPMAVAP